VFLAGLIAGCQGAMRVEEARRVAGETRRQGPICWCIEDWALTRFGEHGRRVDGARS
jgi:hypothetical protein